MWNEPNSKEELNEKEESASLRSDQNLPKGFILNNKCGTGYYFNNYAADKFLRKNGLTHIIRSKEMVPNGYKLEFNGKCITIFSCSHYCQANNTAACVFIDNERIRIVRLNTSANAPAMDSGKDY